MPKQGWFNVKAEKKSKFDSRENCDINLIGTADNIYKAKSAHFAL